MRPVAALAFAFTLAGCGSTGDVFDGTRWAQPVQYCTASPRAAMVDDAIEAVSRVTTSSEVRRVLGPPDARNAGDWLYYVDKRRDGMLDECVSLRVEFRAASVVATVVTDS